MARPGSVKVGDWYLLPAEWWHRPGRARRDKGRPVEVTKVLPVYRRNLTRMDGTPDPKNGAREQRIDIRTVSGLTAHTYSKVLVRKASDAQILGARQTRIRMFLERYRAQVEAALDVDAEVLDEGELRRWARDFSRAIERGD